jgi:SAM-dependent methyltransferase
VTASLRSRWDAAARLVAESRDVLDARPGDCDSLEPPSALVARGWAAFLLSVDEEQLAALESQGLDAPWPEGTPAALLALVERARDVCDVAPLLAQDAPGRPARKGETPRKRAQVDAFARLVLPLTARATRVVDVGSGHGHLTREIAERAGVPVVGLERDATLAGRARALSSGSSPAFAVTDVLRDGLDLTSSDCVMGLHACGELGDALAASVARTGASLALVGCCLQKRRATSRRPLCTSAPGLGDALELPRALLGLSNLAARQEGVEATRVENLAGRERRLALNRLLAGESGRLRLGAEIDGLNRRAAHDDLEVLVARAFTLRGRPAPSREAIADAGRWARTAHARARRLSLPRAMLARVLEVHVLLDRALFLEEHGRTVRVGTLFPAAVSARNLALVAE